MARSTVADHPLVVALRPVARAIGASVITPTRMRTGDIPLEWEGEVVAAMRLPDLGQALIRMIARIERELGGRLADLSREDKQRAIRLLDSRGAFQLRGSIDEVADAMGVSRITVYNYLNAIGARGS